jgi:hypothetical protein
MVSIESLLEDEQGLSMGEMLMVKFCHPSHELTFGVGMNFISYPLVLRYNMFVCACRFCSLVFMHDFSVESKTSGISSLSTSWQDLEARYKSSNEVNMTPRSPRTKPEKMKHSEDLVKKLPNLAGQGASSNPKRNWRQGPTCRRGKTLEDSGSNTGQRRPRAGLKWPRLVGPGRLAQPSPLRDPVSPPLI